MINIRILQSLNHEILNQNFILENIMLTLFLYSDQIRDVNL